MQDNIRTIRPKIVKILKKHRIAKAGIFGSYARGEAKKRSDVDILVKMPRGKSYFDLIRIEDEIRENIGKKVDLVTYGSLNHLLKDRILGEEVRII